jgi:segregation and condensation protein B
VSDPRRRRGSKRAAEAPELDESELIAELRRRAWAWLDAGRLVVPEPEPVVEPAAIEEPVVEEPAIQEPAIEERAESDAGVESRLPAHAPANDATALPSSPPPPPPEVPAKRKRAPRREVASPDGRALLRRKAWWWLRASPSSSPPPAEEVAPPKPKRRGKREAALPDRVVELRRRAWAWFAPRATGESAAGSHAPIRVSQPAGETAGGEVVRGHLKGVLEALVFASEHPLPARELARIAQADLKLVKTLLAELVADYHPRGLRLDEVAGGFVFRTSPVFAPFVREQVAKKPVKMSRAQIETIAIVAYRQPVTRPEIDDVRGVDSGAVLKSLLERELVRILGKKDEPGRPMLYGTTPVFLELFGLKALGDLPTLREFTELTDESKRTYERELGEELPAGGDVGLMGGEGELRRQPAAPTPVDVAALEDDPTLPPEEAAEREGAPEAAAEESAGDAVEEEPPTAEERRDDEASDGAEEQGGEADAEGESGEDDGDADEDEEDDEEDGDEEEDDDEEDEDEEDEDEG